MFITFLIWCYTTVALAGYLQVQSKGNPHNWGLLRILFVVPATFVPAVFVYIWRYGFGVVRVLSESLDSSTIDFLRYQVYSLIVIFAVFSINNPFNGADALLFAGLQVIVSWSLVLLPLSIEIANE
jgi:hypothetical protein